MENINVDIADYKTILFHKGRIDGVVGSCKIDKLWDNLNNSIKDSISKAKGILINFGIHKEQTLFVINDLMGEISDVAHNESDIIFATKNHSSDDKDLIEYEILITGL
ncbi:FtsZ/tubulin family protein [Aliarcobacter butzleri]|uniref:hypothetical protein n=1 Tax=Aliarcobacter butzleri TaxID=28197 RepID=UPI0012F8F73A|nr:hypothetical protein [Aliarcobacter butzleri]